MSKLMFMNVVPFELNVIARDEEELPAVDSLNDEDFDEKFEEMMNTPQEDAEVEETEAEKEAREKAEKEEKEKKEKEKKEAEE